MRFIKIRPNVLMSLSFGLFITSVLVAGCSKKAETTDQSQSSTAASGEQIATGKTVFTSNGCTRCHTMDGQGGRMGPELTHAGADSAHTAQWISDFVKNPKVTKPNTRMPAFGDKIKESDLSALGAYLASLK